MKRPVLNEISLVETMGAIAAGKPLAVLTITTAQWDAITRAAYAAGWTLLEIENETPVRAYRRGLDS
jgi:hypothetical protein